ncbi:proline-serine-threonine phosphatase-interacting protein 2 isoform X2 [Notamacropus eugenii]|uniref:proline-serine-threonine phosphatase-interacting protein 2 isoform X2 n=1 Tax=Notamacropus eugenii TaxID=9315 RepID=UPI003B678C9D
MKASKFRENFWCPHFLSTVGYDSIIHHLNEGRKNCKEFEDFLKERAMIEEKYGKDMINLCRKKPCGQSENNTLKRALEVFKQQIDNVGQSHLQLAQTLREEARKMEEFKEKQKIQRKKIEVLMDNMHKQKQIQYKKTMELFVKLATSKTAAEDSDKTYLLNISLLEKIREDWQIEHIKACEFFEIQECERINYFRNALWQHTNQLSLQCVISDEMFEEVRKSLEMCSIEKDIEYFVAQKRTGEVPPAPILYENFYNSQRNPVPGRNPGPNVGRRGPLPIPQNVSDEDDYSLVTERNIISNQCQRRGPPPIPQNVSEDNDYSLLTECNTNSNQCQRN